MTHSPFYALLLRMKYISRWGLMRSSIPENLSEHSLETAVIAHALAVIDNTYLGGAARPEHIACAALFHDAAEILTGDLPTPVKYQQPGHPAGLPVGGRCGPGEPAGRPAPAAAAGVPAFAFLRGLVPGGLPVHQSG